MELILKKDVENLGFTNDLVIVKNGYGRNFLLPQGLAVLATPSTKKILAETLLIRRVLALTHNNKSRACKLLDIHRTTLYEKLAKYRIGPTEE